MASRTITHLSGDSNQVQNESAQDGGGGGRADGGGGLFGERENPALFYIDVEKKPPMGKRRRGEPQIAALTISETETYTFLTIASTCVSNEEADVEAIKKNNQKYLEVCNSIY